MGNKVIQLRQIHFRASLKWNGPGKTPQMRRSLRPKDGFTVFQPLLGAFLTDTHCLSGIFLDKAE